MNNELKAVHSSELEKFLYSLDVEDDVVKGKVRCFFCQRTITPNNIGAVIPQTDRVGFCCNSDECFSKLIDMGD